MQEGYDLRNIRVLVVEKQLFMWRLLGDVLNQLGVTRVVKVSSIDQAFAVFNQNQVDLIFLDWAPDMDALGFLAQVRDTKTSRDPFVPVIVVTAYSECMHVCKARDAGMTQYLAKPISARRLYGRIKSIVERNRDFVFTDNFFGPDRRRKRMAPDGSARRNFTPDVTDHNAAQKAVPDYGGFGDLLTARSACWRRRWVNVCSNKPMT
ncbi:response regulator [Magnetovibrio sp. PR-2]|uniref:response regulator n=1 Tax=Magnetovibrio sp. PR-2 TaxID=3120356 RepID=UPI002FCDEF82